MARPKKTDLRDDLAFGLAIQMKLRKTGQTQKEVCLALGIRDLYLSGVISGKRKAVSHREKIMQYFDLTEEYIQNALRTSDRHCPECSKVGQAIDEIGELLVMECECNTRWATKSHRCSECGMLNKYPVPGLCISCYELKQEAKRWRRARINQGVRV